MKNIYNFNKLILLPNLITYIRFFCSIQIFLNVVLNLKLNNKIILILFIIGSITDFLDGYLARRYSLTSEIGKIIDPIADKLLVIVSLLFIMSHKVLSYSYWLAFIIMTREVIQFCIREFLRKNNISLDVNNTGKIKTFFQMFAIITLITYLDNQNVYLKNFSLLLLGIACILSVYSLYKYCRISYSKIIKLQSKT